MTGSAMPARLAVEDHEAEGVGILRLRDSYLNYALADVIKARLKQIANNLLDSGRTNIVVDLKNVGVMDSSGLAVLIALKKQVDMRGGRLALCSMSAMIQRLFALTRLDRAFEIHPSQEAAFQALRGEQA